MAEMHSVSRGSLKQCVVKCYHLFKDGPYEYLSIFHNPRGKYYMIATENELKLLGNDHLHGHIRLVLRVTKGELNSILRPRMEQLTFNLDPNFNPRLPS